MRLMRWSWIGWLLLCPAVFAAEVCVSVDTTGWTTRQQNWREAIAYRLAFEAGQNLLPTVTGDAICFTDPTFDVPTVITVQTLLNRMAKQEADNAAELVQLEQAKQTRRGQLKAMGLTDKEIERLTQ